MDLTGPSHTHGTLRTLNWGQEEASAVLKTNRRVEDVPRHAIQFLSTGSSLCRVDVIGRGITKEGAGVQYSSSNPCTLHRHTSQPGARYSLLLRFCSAYPGATLKETPNLLSICPSKAKLSVFSLSFPHGTGEEVPVRPSKQLWLSDHALRA